MQRFIDANWHTVPLSGKLERLEGGKKTLPFFSEGWRQKYWEVFNNKATKVGGAMTGSVSGIIAIDCDNTLTYNMFRALDPDYNFVFISKGKGYSAGTIIYKYDEELKDGFSINDNIVALDFYSDYGFIYLPTEGNKTKEPFEWCELKEIPDIVKLALVRMKPVIREATKETKNIITASCLAPLVQKFIDKRKFVPGLFRVITPKSFREEPEYVQNNYLHPDNVPQGRGSEYLMKVSAILGADPSIDEELYTSAMHDINDLWSEPMDANKLDKTILDPMLEGKSSIEGNPIWYYDADWKLYNLTVHTKRDTLIDVCYDDQRGLYYMVDREAEKAYTFNKDNDVVMHINSIAISPPKKPELLRAMPLINVISEPSEPFGFIKHDGNNTAKTLNTFKQTHSLKVLHNPELHAHKYKRPEATLKYLETLVPENDARDYLIRFIKRKLTTFDYSSVVLFFIGVQGSGKDTFVEILSMIMGGISRPSVKEFLEVYNDFMVDNYFVQLDEYGNQLTNIRDKDAALGKLKAYTGKRAVDIRAMRSTGKAYEHNVTFVMTANKNPLMLEDRDRRIALFSTPNIMTDIFEDVPAFRDKVLAEVVDFCYYLATEVEMLPRKEYIKPFDSTSKHRLIADSMYASAKLVYVLKNQMYDYLKELAYDHNCDKVVTDIDKGRLYSSSLEELYDSLTEYKGDMRALNKALKGEGIGQKQTTHGGTKEFYLNLEFPEVGFNDYSSEAIS